MKRLAFCVAIFAFGFFCSRYYQPTAEIKKAEPTIQSKEIVVVEDRSLGLRSTAQLEGDTITVLNVSKLEKGD